MVEIRFFGHADVRVDGVSVKLAKRASTLAMLGLLILRRGKSLSRSSLAFTLFPDADETAALAELRRCLYLANKALPEQGEAPWFVADGETVSWNAQAAAFVDVLAFEQLAADPETQGAAIELYAGDLLEEIYDDWIVTERERLRARFLAILTESFMRHRARREFARAIACARRVLVVDPWREDTLRQLVGARYESGDTAGALADYDEFVKRLRDELGVAPMPETLAIRQSILRNEPLPGSLPSLRTSGEGSPPRSAPFLPFVGRENELATLHAAWSRAARGAGEFFVLQGEAGVGKTRLTAELAALVQSEGGRVFVGTTAAPEAMPYQALAEALRSGLPLLLARPPAAARRALLARLVPELGEAGAAEIAAPDEPPERETARLYDALSDAIRTLASPRPLLLLLEDLHWAGPATLEALGAIVRGSTRVPVLVLGTCREEETPADHPLRSLLRGLRVHRNVHESSLERFGLSDVAELVTRMEGLRHREPALAQELYARTEGNALFLNEAIAGVLERNESPERALTASMRALLAARIERLGDEARAVAEVAAVVGIGCRVGFVHDVTNLPASAIARGFDELLDRRIFREAGARARYDYVFTHQLIATAFYDAIEPVFRAQRHARVARTLEKQRTGSDGLMPAREIARQHELGGDRASAAHWYLAAARDAATVYAYGDAIGLATRAVENASSIEIRRAALDVRERAHGRRGDRSGQRTDIEELARLAGGDQRCEFDVLTRRVLLARTLGESDEEGRLISELQTVAQTLDDGARAQALAQRATYAGLRSRHAEGFEPAHTALALYERLGDVRGQLECLFLLVDFATNTGDLEASRRYLELMRTRAASMADRIVEARALSVAAVAALLRQEYRESFELSKEALAIQVATNDREAEAASRGRLAVTAAWLADFGTALREFDLALRTYESIGHKRGLALTHTNRTMQLMRLGLFDEALASIERSNALFETVHEQRTIVANGVNASFVQLHRGDPVKARALAHDALVAAREIGFPVFEAAALANLGNAERELGQFDAAIEHMQAGIALRRPIQAAAEFVDDLSDLALCYAMAGRDHDALATARELAAIGESSFEHAFWPHYIYWAMGAGFRAGDEREQARRAVARARVELFRFAGHIDDERARAAFLAVPVNARIAAEA
ncbi:MAG: AAA family ATPase [Candidatus Velthaea sp.]